MSSTLQTLPVDAVPDSIVRRTENRVSLPSFVIAFVACLLVLSGFLLSSERFSHWFLLPLLVCGTLIGTDAVDWVSGRREIFDPVGLIGLFGFHLFFLAPLLHVHWDYWMVRVTPPSDWRVWLGVMATVNVIGLVLYHLGRRIRLRVHDPRQATKYRRLNEQRFTILVGVALVFTGALQFWVYQKYGGILGYIATVEEAPESFRGMGWIFMLSESFPISAMMGYAHVARRHAWLRSWGALVFALFVFFVLKMLFGGLRGSRANTLWGLFWAVGLIHFLVRPVARKFIMIGLVAALGFIYVYGFYKGAGMDALTAFEGAEARAELSKRTRRSFEGNILGDLARADVQAFVLFRQLRAGSDYDYALGRTYLGAVAQVVPRSVWPSRPMTKVKEGTLVQYGANSITSEFYSTRQYGLAGETLLNFGVLLVPLALGGFGLAIGWLRGAISRLNPGDSRLFLVPLGIYLCFVVLLLDSDNLVVVMIKNGVIPALLVLLCSGRSRRLSGSPPATSRS